MIKSNIYLNLLLKLVFIVLLFLVIASCDNLDQKSGKVVASVDESYLYKDDLLNAGVLLDSGLVTHNYISKWVKNQLVLNHANELSKEVFEVDIDVLVAKYKDNLLKAYYEKYLVQNQLDTNILEEDIKKYYNDHKSEFRLNHKILKCRLIKVSKKHDKKKFISKMIKSRREVDKSSLVDYCNNQAEFCLISYDKWYEWKEVKSDFPRGIHLNKRDIGKSVRTETKNYVYYIYLIDYHSYKDNAPFTYIKPQAKKAILFKRRSNLLEYTKEELYNNALKNNRIKIFLKN